MKMHLNKFHYFNIEFISTTLKVFPDSKIGFFFFSLLKFIGLIVFSNSFELLDGNTSNISICNIFRSMTFFGSMERENLIFINYELTLFIIYFLLLLPLIIYVILFIKCPCSSSDYYINSKGKTAQLTFTSTYKALSKVSAVLGLIYIFFSQHLIEFLLFPMMLIIPSGQINNLGISSKLEKIKSVNNINSIVLLSLNSVFAFLLNLYILFFFKFYNRPFLSNGYIHKFTFNNYFLYLLLLIFNFQGFHYLIHLGTVVKLIFTILSIVLSALLVFFALSRFIERTYHNYILLSYIYFSIYSSILSLIIFLTKSNTSQRMTTEILIEKFLSEILFVFLTHYALMNIQDAELNKAIRENILIKTKNLKGEYLFRLIDILKQCMHDYKNFALLFDLLETNQNKISKGNENGKDRVNLMSYFDKLKQIRKLGLSIEQRHICFKKKYNKILVLVEAEIISHVFNLFCSKRIKEEIRIPLLHCDFISYFKLNYSFSLFLIQEYLAKIPKLSFESIVYFNSLKQLILNERENRIKQNHNNKSLHVQFGNFINYFQRIQEIRSHLIKNCANYQQIIYLKNIYSEMKHNQESRKFNEDIELLFDKCMKIEKSIHKMEHTITENFSDNTLKNPEIIFLITNFYEITQTKVPDYIKENMLNITCYDDVTKFDSSFFDQGFDHPLILTLSSANSIDFRNVKVKSNFSIYYVSQKLINELGYKESELIGRDYHILLPQMFAEANSTELKKVFFIDENFQINNSQFILSKEGYYVQMRETSGMIPSLKNDTIVIMNIALDPVDKNNFLFITDINSNIITMTKNVEETFQLNNEMIKRLGITFSGLFNLNNEKILNDFNDRIKSITKIDIGSIDSLMTIMTYNTYEKVLSSYKIKKIKDELLTITMNKKKKRLCSCLQKIRKQIEEQEYDTDWVLRITRFENLCAIDKCESSFDIIITLKNVGNVPYFFIKVHDKDNSLSLDEEEGLPNLAGLNKSMNLNDIISHEDDAKKFNDSFRKSNFNPNAQNKSPNTSHSNITHNFSQNISSSMNETNHQLLFTNKKNNSFKTPFRSRSLINKVNYSSKKEMQKNNELITSLKKRENCCSIILFILMLGISTCFVLNFFIKRSGIQEIEDSSNLIFNIEKLKESILESAILVTSGCYQLDDLEPNPYDGIDFTLEMIKSQLFVRGSEMFSFYNEYYEYLKKDSYIKQIEAQLLTLQEGFVISSMNEKFMTNTYESSFEAEVNFFHFHCGFMKTSESFIECEVKKHFLGGVNHDTSNRSSEDEIFFYYTSYNILINFMRTIDQLIHQSSVYFYDRITEIKRQFLFFNLSIFVLALSVLFLFSGLIIIYKQRIVSYLKLFIVKSEKTMIIEKKLNNFRTILISFDNEICEQYEINMEKLNILYRDTTRDQSIISNQHKHNNNNSSNLNDSTRTNTTKQEKKKAKEDDYYQEEQFNANTMRIFSMKILRKALILFLFSLLCSMSVIISNIINDTLLFYNILLSVETAFSYLDYTASLNELILYYRVSILYRNANLITLPERDYESMMYMYKLATTTVDMENDQRYKLLGESKMAFLYYRTNFESQIVAYYESGNNMNILSTLKEYNKLIDTQGIACESFSSAYTKYVDDFQDSFDQAFLMRACLNLEGGNSDQGINKQMDHFSATLFDQYIDFVKKPDGDLAAYSQASALISCVKLMTFVYNVSWHISIKIVELEMKALFANVNLVEVVYQLIELMMNTLFCALYTIFILGYLKLSIDRYGIIIERLKITLN